MRDPVTHAPVILKPHEPVAERVVLPGDPGRALRLAQQLTDAPRMLNHHRGLWGYTGRAADGEALTVQSTGLGGPSTAGVVAELIALGARRLVRVGTAAGLGGVALGELVVAEAALAGDGTSRSLGAGERVAADVGLTGALAAGGRFQVGLVASVDVHDAVEAERWARAGALAVDLSTAAVLAAAARHGAVAGAVLAMTRAGGERIGDEELVAVEAELGRVALGALGV